MIGKYHAAAGRTVAWRCATTQLRNSKYSFWQKLCYFTSFLRVANEQIRQIKNMSHPGVKEATSGEAG
jgi:hypothetical protein